MIRGMIVNGEMGKDVAKYTGSTTGDSVSNEICSQYTRSLGRSTANVT